MIIITNMTTTTSTIAPYDRVPNSKLSTKQKPVSKASSMRVSNTSLASSSTNPKTIPKAPTSIELPLIDLGSTDRASTVEKIREASKNLGLFQVVNHGIPLSVMDETLKGVRRFHEQDVETKKRFYTRDVSNTVVYNSNIDLYSSPAANWRDTFFSVMAPLPPKAEELPEVCRDIQIEYSNHVLNLVVLLFRLISEALGLEPNHLGDMDSNKGLTFVGHCYPACPQPDLTMGATKHTDDGFLNCTSTG
ncbi:putative non-heme dioxygenase domain, isopenicillin N synthase [Helianthus annuus]|nr:putative non-heme dioxygenase domain, isopenicillin N synthase [Helianthus annuus]